jgi:hypothetical protein
VVRARRTAVRPGRSYVEFRSAALGEPPQSFVDVLTQGGLSIPGWDTKTSGNSDFGALPDIETECARQAEILEDPRSRTNDTGVQSDAEMPDRRPGEDD